MFGKKRCRDAGWSFTQDSIFFSSPPRNKEASSTVCAQAAMPSATYTAGVFRGQKIQGGAKILEQRLPNLFRVFNLGSCRDFLLPIPSSTVLFIQNAEQRNAKRH